MIISRVSTVRSLKKVDRRLEYTFNDPQKRESLYFNFYDGSLTIHGFPPNLPMNKEGFNNSVTPYDEHFLILESFLKILLLKEIKLQVDTT